MNVYEQNNKLYFDELKQLVENNLRSYPKSLQTTRRYLLDWLNSCLPKLSDPVFGISVKVYWILYGLTDFPKCLHCGKPILSKKIKLNKGYGKFCSNYCLTHSKYRVEMAKQTCMEKYGVEHYSKTEEYKIQYEKTCTERYGGVPFSKNSSIREHLYDKLSEQEGRKITNPSQVPEIAAKIKQSKTEKYGEAGFNIEKQKATCIERYGVEYYYQSEDFKEKYKATCLNKYGVENAFQAEECKEKSKHTCLDRYGVEYYSQTEMHAEQCKQTCIEKYGTEFYLQSEDFKGKSKRTCLDRYGVEYYLQSADRFEKSKKTCLKKYGVEYYLQTDEFRERSKKSCLDHYGVEYSLQSDKVKQASRLTCLDKYGVEHPSQCHEIMQKAHRRYTFEGRQFDSATEIEFFVYMRDCGYKVLKDPGISFEYEFSGKTHAYFSDFMVISPYGVVELIEIKGDQFFRENGTMFCPYRDKAWTDEQYAEKCAQYEAKRQCMLANGIKIIRYSSEYMKFIRSYVQEKYGKDYCQQFRNS